MLSSICTLVSMGWLNLSTIVHSLVYMDTCFVNEFFGDWSPALGVLQIDDTLASRPCTSSLFGGCDTVVLYEAEYISCFPGYLSSSKLHK